MSACGHLSAPLFPPDLVPIPTWWVFMFRYSGREQAFVLNWEVTGKAPVFHFCISWVHSCRKGHGERGILVSWLTLLGGTWLTNTIQRPVQVGAPGYLLGRWECVCVRSSLVALETWSFIALIFFQNPSVPGDIPETLVTDALEVTIMSQGSLPSRSHHGWEYQRKRVLVYLGSLAIYPICLYFLEHPLTMMA